MSKFLETQIWYMIVQFTHLHCNPLWDSATMSPVNLRFDRDMIGLEFNTKYHAVDTDQSGSSSTESRRDFFGGLALYPDSLRGCRFMPSGPVGVLTKHK